MLTGLFSKDASFGPLLNLHMGIVYSWESFDLDSAWLRDSRPYQISFLSKVLACLEMHHTRVLVWGSQSMLTGFFKNATFGPPPNLHTCISLVEVCRFGQCLGWRFSPIYIFFSCVFSRV